MKSYCTLCGNVEFEGTEDNPNHHCPDCRSTIEGPLKKAWEMFEQVSDEYGICCFGISRQKNRIHYHSEAFNGQYPHDAKEDDPLAVAVEAGINFFEDCATTYWIFDNDSSVDSFEFGEPILYNDPKFRERLDAQIDEAAEAAWNSDVLTCLHCGYHYSSSAEPEHPDECYANPDNEEGD